MNPAWFRPFGSMGVRAETDGNDDSNEDVFLDIFSVVAIRANRSDVGHCFRVERVWMVGRPFEKSAR